MPKMDIIVRQLYIQICMCVAFTIHPYVHVEFHLLTSFLAFARDVAFELCSVSGPPTSMMKL